MAWELAEFEYATPSCTGGGEGQLMQLVHFAFNGLHQLVCDAERCGPEATSGGTRHGSFVGDPNLGSASKMPAASTIAAQRLQLADLCDRAVAMGGSARGECLRAHPSWNQVRIPAGRVSAMSALMLY